MGPTSPNSQWPRTTQPVLAVSASRRAVHLVGGRQPAVGREPVDETGQLLAEAGQQLTAPKPGALGEERDLIGGEHLRQLVRRDRLVLSGPDPRARGVALAGALELF